MHTDNPRGIACMIGSMALFVSNDALMKYASESIPVAQAIFIRGAVVTAILLAVAAAQGHLAHWRKLGQRDVVARAGFEGVGSYGYLLALAHMPLAITLAINMAVPLVILPLAVLLLNERVGWRRWTALAVGFAGVLMVVQPGPTGIDWWALLALASTGVHALRDVVTRRIPAAIPSVLVTALSAAVLTVFAGVLVLNQGWQVLETGAAFTVVGAAVMVAGGMHLMVLGTRVGEASVVAGFRYTALIWAVGLGYAIWGDLPGAAAWAGIALIIGAGLYAAHRERLRRAEQAR
jgi:drug/metabolite transporter (DMT)-like permease